MARHYSWQRELPASASRWWAATSTVNVPISASPVVLCNYGAGPLSGLPGIGFNAGAYGCALFDEEVGRSRVTVTMTGVAGWLFDNVPIPSQLLAYTLAMNAAGDINEHHNAIVDGTKVWNLYGIKQVSGAWQSFNGGALRKAGDGLWDNAYGPAYVGRASGFASSFGVIRRQELTDGVIDHALVCGWPKDRIKKTGWVLPATSSDGEGLGTAYTVTAPMGSRIQLDPNLTPAQILAMGITSTYLPVALAMQKYGCFISDSTSWMTLYAESWNNAGQVAWPSTSGWYPGSVNLVPYLRIVQGPASVSLDNRTTFGQPHQ